MAQVRGNSMAPPTQQFTLVNKNSAQLQGSPASQKSNFVGQQHGKVLQPNDMQQQSPMVGGPQGAQPAATSGQKLLSLKHIQIQNARMANSQSDNYNSDNDSNAQLQSLGQVNQAAMYPQPGGTISGAPSMLSSTQGPIMNANAA